MYVNAGANAVTVLQRLLTDMGFACDADGVIGPATIRAAQMAQDAAPPILPMLMPLRAATITMP